MPNTLTIIIVVLFLGSALLFALAERAKRKQEYLGVAQQTAGRAPNPVLLANLSPDALARITECVNQGEPIRAINLLRELTGLSLVDAKRVVDNWDRTGPIPEALLEGGDTTDPHIAALNDQQRREIDALVDAGKLIEAIKVVRTHTGLGLKEAKAIVDRWNS